MMELERMEARLAEVKERLWWLDMADHLWGEEKREYERLFNEQLNLIYKIRALKKG